MKRLFRAIAATATLFILALPPVAEAQGKAIPATPDNIASFLGDWTITARSSSYGEATVTLHLKVTDGKVVGEASDANGKHTLTDVSKYGSSLVATYLFDYQGSTLDAVVTLTAGDKGVDASIEFASGAAQFVGTAVKKSAVAR
jgi:hypothetical protein